MRSHLNKIKDQCQFRLKQYDDVPARLYEELDYINESGGAEALCFISDLVHFLRREQIHVGPGHGYLTCSLLCYGLGVTDVNPLKWDLPFERFARSFIGTPQIFIETSSGGKAKAFEYLKAHKGKTFDIERKNGGILTYLSGSDSIISIEIHIVEIPTLDDIKRCCNQCGKDNRQIRLNQSTLKKFQEGDTTKISLFGQQSTIDILKEMKPDCFSDLYLIYALDRPGFMGKLKEVVMRKHDKNIGSVNCPTIDRILMESYGVLVYQEQKIQIEKQVNNIPQNPLRNRIEELINVPDTELFLKGHAIAMTMMAIQQASYEIEIE